VDALLAAIPAVADEPGIGAAAPAELGVAAAAATSSTKTAATAETAATAASESTTAAKTASSSRAAASESRTGARGTSWSGACLTPGDTVLIAGPCGIVAQASRTASEAEARLAARIAADLLQSPAQSAVQHERFVGALGIDSGRRFHRFRSRTLVRGAFDLICELGD